MESLFSSSSSAFPSVVQSSSRTTNILSKFSKDAFEHANDAMFFSLVMENLAFKDNWGKFRRSLNNKFSQPHLIDKGIVALKEFLILKAAVDDINDDILSPSPLLDELWSYFTQFTREYEIMCKNLTPEEKAEKIIHRSFHDKEEPQLYENTLALYLHAFETTPSEDFWPRPPSQTSREKRANAPSNSEAESTSSNNNKKVKAECNIKKENSANDNDAVIILDEDEEDKEKMEQKDSTATAIESADLDSAIKYNSSGNKLYKQEKYDHALVEYRRALVIRKSVLGNDHTDTAISYHNIGCALYRKGQYDEALDYYNKALPIRESVLGKKTHENCH